MTLSMNGFTAAWFIGGGVLLLVLDVMALRYSYQIKRRLDIQPQPFHFGDSLGWQKYHADRDPDYDADPGYTEYPVSDKVTPSDVWLDGHHERLMYDK